MELKPIKTKKKYEEIVNQIKQLVIEGQIKPGDKLPSERHLVESFKVSRASIREALSALEIMGVLEVRTGEGAYIRQLQDNSMAVSLTWVLGMGKASVSELLEFRRMIEVQGVGYAAERATEEELAELEVALNALKSKIYTSGLKAEIDEYFFHYKIAKATQNKIIIQLMDTVTDHLQHLINTRSARLNEGNYTPDILFEEHLGIYLALKKRDIREAREQMLHHLQRVEAEILKFYN
ncbi:MAG TPA: FadR family transcriptional regulator [Peptococcaceae bacterium]|nr:FadR family transcriptional regulator [Peptococcaceae bacterium]